jgi:hypothetical protein
MLELVCKVIADVISKQYFSRKMCQLCEYINNKKYLFLYEDVLEAWPVFCGCSQVTQTVKHVWEITYHFTTLYSNE